MRLHALERTAATARFVARARVVPTDGAAISAVTDSAHDPREEVVFVGRGTPPATPGCTGSVTPSEVALRPEQELEVDAGCDGFVVLAIAYQPGLEVDVDGKRADLLPAEVVFSAVRVPAGRHVVKWRYRVRTLAAAFATSCGGALALLALVLGGRSRRLSG